MLNWAARYYPILRVLREEGLLEQASLLEIGSGSKGIGTFRKVPFTGCDLTFASDPEWPMTAVVGSAAELPFANASFDVVLGSDVLEHIPPALREKVIAEALRVAGKMVIFGFPCGKLAHASDTALRQEYLESQLPVPGWLEEHMDADFPEADLFQNLPGWTVHSFGNESLEFHRWMMRREMNGRFTRVAQLLMRFLPGVLEWLLRYADSAPYYRRIFVLKPVPTAR